MSTEQEIKQLVLDAFRQQVDSYIGQKINEETIRNLVEAYEVALRRVTGEPGAYVEVVAVEGNAIEAIAHIPLRMISVSFTVAEVNPKL